MEPVASTNSQTDLTAGQIAFFLAYPCVVLLWLYSEYLKRSQVTKDPGSGPDDEIPDAAKEKNEEKTKEAEVPKAPVTIFSLSNPLTDVLLLRKDALISHNSSFEAMAEFGMHLLFYFVSDRTDLFPEPSEKHYSRDAFWFIYLLLVIYTVVTSLGKTHAIAYLNRDQTEEWKGWMQCLFLMYHYFEAAEQYNSIRIYIAAYVWMTGFGNFSFYYIRKDFSPSRFFQMLWRLNFLVFWVCVIMGNDYMLYYICPMHTIWTIAVYIVLLIGKDFNTNNFVVLFKIVGSLALVTFLWSSQSLFYTMWSPLEPVVGYVNPAHPETHPMHEWWFRSGLDKYIWIFGMVCANFHPNTEAFLKYMDNLPLVPRWACRGLLVAVLLGVGLWWYSSVFTLPKREYNALHPTTSWIPLIIFILLRNLTPTLREYSLHFFAFLGKITLETYIGQFHIWLHTDIPNGQPKTLMTIVPDYPLINFLVCTPIYIWVSYRLFHLTNTLKGNILPSGDERRLYRNLLLVPCAWVPFYIAGRCIKTVY
eukprot:TRINITY_DN783_c1_g1_i1.p1 TRINITY_DN783_c1_g1~~TRINITY_DN783_c1_g1_i1.p1  ORF type:complete len:532 (+),score=201.95 TRINITY_DN783_c1_g1_i1:36-1631(+)